MEDITKGFRLLATTDKEAIEKRTLGLQFTYLEVDEDPPPEELFPWALEDWLLEPPLLFPLFLLPAILIFVLLVRCKNGIMGFSWFLCQDETEMQNMVGNSACVEEMKE